MSSLPVSVCRVQENITENKNKTSMDVTAKSQSDEEYDNVEKVTSKFLFLFIFSL